MIERSRAEVFKPQYYERRRIMLKQERQLYILRKVGENGKVTTNELVEELNIAQDTIRKDFQELSAKGLVVRVHGGIMKIDHQITTFAERANIKTSVKQRLAKAAFDLVSDQHVFYIDGGTTNLCFAETLPSDFGGTVITNSPAVALALCQYPGAEINLIGGILHNKMQVVEDLFSVQRIQAMNIGCGIISTTSLSLKNGITYPSFNEATFKKIVMEQSKLIVAIAVKEKLNSTSAFLAKDISVIDILVTDETSEEILQPYRMAGIHVVSVDVVNDLIFDKVPLRDNTLS